MSGYKRSDVEKYLPTLFNEELRTHGFREERKLTLKADEDKYRNAMPPELRKAASNPAHAGSHNASCADMQRAWELADLTLRQQQVLIMRYGLRWELDDCADYFDNAKQSCHESEEAGIDNILAFLNTGQSRTRSSRIPVRR